MSSLNAKQLSDEAKHNNHITGDSWYSSFTHSSVRDFC